MFNEWVIVAIIGIVLLFSAKKLPDMARGLGQSMRVFKAETRGMKEDEQAAGQNAAGQNAAGQNAPGRALEQGSTAHGATAAPQAVPQDVTPQEGSAPENAPRAGS